MLETQNYTNIMLKMLLDQEPIIAVWGNDSMQYKYTGIEESEALYIRVAVLISHLCAQHN
jgi:hypothetical protein